MVRSSEEVDKGNKIVTSFASIGSWRKSRKFLQNLPRHVEIVSRDSKSTNDPTLGVTFFA